ncbi:hypothetical protein CEXT_61081 [Caerostris extrusa]|uniref:Uncharacterized protein n=1 Tax=Caerostris extrusa TaxID=172846 RepID=A0AAV4SFV8_CAEEX|nr:hypothetical protein CEXT_61081 [Caerostris extrusa]
MPHISKYQIKIYFAPSRKDELTEMKSPSLSVSTGTQQNPAQSQFCSEVLQTRRLQIVLIRQCPTYQTKIYFAPSRKDELSGMKSPSLSASTGTQQNPAPKPVLQRIVDRFSETDALGQTGNGFKRVLYWLSVLRTFSSSSQAWGRLIKSWDIQCCSRITLVPLRILRKTMHHISKYQTKIYFPPSRKDERSEMKSPTLSASTGTQQNPALKPVLQ